MSEPPGYADAKRHEEEYAADLARLRLQDEERAASEEPWWDTGKSARFVLLVLLVLTAGCALLLIHR